MTGGGRRGPARARPPAGPGGRTRGGRGRPVDADGEPAGRRRTVLTTRAAILALVVCALAVLLAVPARRYFSQRAQISQLQTETTDQRARVAALDKEVARAKNPDDVRNEARLRLHYQLPGEKVYQLTPTPTATPTPAPSGVAHVAPGDAPWYSKLWAGATATPASPTPLAHPTGR